MERLSQIILRNRAHFETGELLLFNPPADGLHLELVSGTRSLSCWSQDFRGYSWFRKQPAPGFTSGFGVLPDAGDLPSSVILFAPREKELLEMLLHFFAANSPPGAALWLAGENNAGIKSAGKVLGKYFGQVTKVDAARHCALFRASDVLSVKPFEIAEYQQKWLLGSPGSELRMVSLPGAFAHGRLDRGTALLLKVISAHPAILKAAESALDFGCGAGVIGLYLLSRQPALQMTLLDSSALALESARRSLEANGFQANLLPSDGLGEVAGKFDAIVANPPFHQGVATDLGISRKFLQAARGRLRKRGTILLVCNRHLPYESWLREGFAVVDALESNHEFKVLRATGPKDYAR